jgi:signal transduction histidine kinase
MKYSASRSLSRKITLSMALRLMCVTLALVVFSFLHVSSVVSRMIEENLEKYIRVRAERESEVFKMTEEGHRVMADRLAELYAHPVDRKYEFERHFIRYPDGAIRQRTSFDTEKTPSFFIPKGVRVDPRQRALAMGTYQFLNRECLSSLASYSDCWISFPDGMFGIFYPSSPDYSIETPANFKASDYQWFKIVDPKNNPERASRWTNTYLDPNAKVWMVTLSTPIYVNGKFFAVLGNDLEMDSLFKRTANFGMEGTKNFIFKSDGTLIAHPDYQKKIWDSQGKLSIRDLKEDGILTEALGFTQNADHLKKPVVKLPNEDVLLAVSKLDGPDWYIATVYPKSLIRAASMDACRLILLLGSLGLLVEIILLIRILNRKVEEPLESMVRVVRKVSRGEINAKIDLKTDDELEILANSFNEMTTKLEFARAETQKAMDNALSASHAKSRFVANMSHEIRTPLHGIIGMAQFLDQTQLNEEQSRFVEVIRNSGKTLLSIVNQVLDISKIESNKFELENIEFELEPLLKEVVSSLQYAAQMKNLPLKLKLDFSLKRRLKGDPTRVKQVIFNLVNNAIKFSQTGEIMIRVQGLNESSHEVLVRIEVEDHGMGIQESVLPRLFTPFAQADISTARKFGGTGLGLYLCKNFVEMMGGSIGVKSKVNEGSLFWFEIPFDLGSKIEIEAKPVYADRIQLIEVFKNVKPVLVAEDYPTNQFLMVKLLEGFGLKCDVVQNGKEALEVLEKNQYSLILMDCQMPEMDGYEASTAIRSRVNASYRYIPIVAVSANAMKGDREKCLAAGMNDLISKPINAKEFQEKLKYWIIPGDSDDGALAHNRA